jgi:magnesium transporter
MLRHLLQPEIDELISAQKWTALKEVIREWPAADTADLLENLEAEPRLLVFRMLPRDLEADVFSYLTVDTQEDLLRQLTGEQQNKILSEMATDDLAALIEELPGHLARQVLGNLSPEALRGARQLLGYHEDSVGRVMTTDFLRVRAGWTIQEALEYIRKHGRDAETVNVIYVTDEKERLVDDLRIRQLLFAEPSATIESLMDENFVALKATDPQEEAVRVMQKYDRVALPVVDSAGVLVGIVTSDDVLDIVQEAATEDIQRFGGSEALEDAYLRVGMGEMIRKRAGWLTVLFLGETLTATAMGHFEHQLDKAVVLALFIPLIISSGGNSGSQATSLIIRGLAVGDVTMRDWYKVFWRELVSGVALGCTLGILALLKVAFWPSSPVAYGEHYLLVGLTVSLSLVGVVVFGTLVGSMLPFILRRFGLDPAVSSAPFVATLVDVTGLIIYFTVAVLLLTGTML